MKDCYTKVTFKPSYGMEPILVTESEAATLKAAQDAEDLAVELPRLHQRVPVPALGFFTETSQAVVNQSRVLPSPARPANREPLYDDKGKMRSAWIKKTITEKEWVQQYSHSSYYFKLPGELGEVIVAHCSVLYNTGLPEGWGLCTPGECEYLQDAMVMRHPFLFR